MPIFRTDRYIKVSIDDYELKKSSQSLLQILQNISDLRNIQMTMVSINREEQGKIRIEQWYEITGALNVPEGGKSFWVISKPSSKSEPYHFFMRVDRNIEAKDYESAQNNTSEWINQVLMKPISSRFSIKAKSADIPEAISDLVKKLGESK